MFGTTRNELFSYRSPRLPRSLPVGHVRLGTDAQQHAAFFPVPSPSTLFKMASTSSSSPFISVVSPLANVYDRFSQWKIALGLSNPGTVENITKEVKCELRLALYHHHTPSYPAVFARRVISHVLYTLESRVIHY